MRGILYFPPEVKKYHVLNSYIRSRKKFKKHETTHMKKESIIIFLKLHLCYIESATIVLISIYVGIFEKS